MSTGVVGLFVGRAHPSSVGLVVGEDVPGSPTTDTRTKLSIFVPPFPSAPSFVKLLLDSNGGVFQTKQTQITPSTLDS